ALPEATAAPAPDVTSPPAAPAAASPTPATDSADAVRVQLAAFRSESQAQVASQRLQEAFHDELSGRTFHVERADLGAKGVFFRLQAGPLASRDEAAALCSRLKQRGQPCIVVAP
ncbi:MAG: SPOR domain-containing protein, partial [Rhodospirillaceae bacterium]|nr:SPOR domain-containing protein [Rhodospirillaceae bacterium]